MKEKANIDLYDVLVTVVMLLSLLLVAGSVAFAREAESGGSGSGSSGGSSSVDDNSSGDNGGFDSARDILERGAGATGVSDDFINGVKLRGDGTVDDDSGLGGFDDDSDDFVNGVKLRGDGSVDDNSSGLGGFVRNLGVGDRSDDVLRLQRELEVEGVFVGSTTGFFGEGTRGAVMEFQRERGLPATGFVGPMTRDALNNRRNASATVFIGDDSSRGGNSGPSDNSGPSNDDGSRQSSAPFAVRIFGEFLGMLARIFGFGR